MATITPDEGILTRWVRPDDPEAFPPESGRYVFYVSHSCPFAHRGILARHIKGLEDAVPMIEMAPTLPASGIGWHFDTTYPDPVNGWSRLKQAYDQTFGGDYDGRVSEPILWDTETRSIVSNESLDILRMMGESFDAWARNAIDLRPSDIREESDALGQHIAQSFAGQFYEAHFRAEGAEKNALMDGVYTTGDELEERLRTNRYLLGDRICEADLILFPALTRFESVYTPLFGFNGKTMSDYPNLSGYMRDLAQTYDLSDSVRFQINVESYYLSPGLNPTDVKPPETPVPDLTRTHGRS